MARMTLILTVLTTVIALLGGFKYLMNEVRQMREHKRLTGRWLAALIICGIVSFLYVPDSEAVCIHTNATTWTVPAAGGVFTEADTRSCVFQAQEGDTVILPTGTLTWTGTVGLAWHCNTAQLDSVNFDRSFCLASSNVDGQTKHITIQGQGIGQTIIIDLIDKTQGGDRQVFAYKLVSGGAPRITGVEIRQGAGIAGCGGGKSSVTVNGTSTTFRFDHNKIVTRNNCLGLQTAGYVRGVVDHNVFDNSIATSNFSTIIEFAHETWGVTVNDDGATSWAQADTVGTAEAMYFEDNDFINDQTSGFAFVQSFDGSAGSRTVIRHNRFCGGGGVTNHGTDTSPRSARQIEVYKNIWRGVNCSGAWNLLGQVQAFSPVFSSRGGVSIVFGNDVLFTNISGSMPPLHLVSYFGVPADGRNRAGGFLLCNGTNPWDQNLVATGNPNTAGRKCIDQTGAGFGDYVETTSDSQTCSAIPRNKTLGCTIAWPRQVAQPSYSWSNFANGVASNSGISTVGGVSVITMGVDIIDGVRPTKGDGSAYCTDGNNCLTTDPFTYPHPLVGAAGQTEPPFVPGQFFLRFAELILPVMGVAWHCRGFLARMTLASLVFVGTSWQLTQYYAATLKLSTRTQMEQAVVKYLEWSERRNT